jgi:hypothetical protein
MAADWCEDGFCVVTTRSSVASRSDITLFTLFAYFTVCRLKDLGFKPYRQLVLSQDGQKMLVLLHFLFNEEMLLKYCRDEWMKLYDAEVPPAAHTHTHVVTQRE